MKKLFYIMLAILFVLSMFTSTVFAEDIDVEAEEPVAVENIEEEAAAETIELPKYAKVFCNHQGEALPVGSVIILMARVDLAEIKYSIKWEATPDNGTTIYEVGTGNEFKFILDEENVNWKWRAVIIYLEGEIYNGND